MKQSLFLHYGPGGNSYLEEQILGDTWLVQNYWNQPKVKNESNPFKELVTRCALKADKSELGLVVAHSFGNDILCVMNSSKVEANVLISPLYNMFSAMWSLGNFLNKQEPSQSLKLALDQSESLLQKMPEEIFWNLVSQIAVHSYYGRSFWATDTFFSKYIELMGSAPAFDAVEWQKVMQDYLFNSPAVNWFNFKNKRTLAIFGEKDPYLSGEKELGFWKEILGENNVVVVKDAGHFPHLEKSAEVAQIINSWVKI